MASFLLLIILFLLNSGGGPNFLGTGPILSNPYAELHMQFAEMGLF